VPRAGLSQAAVVDAALAIVDDAGLDAVTLAAVAQRTGVATPSLYKHVAGLSELRMLLGVRVLEEMAEQFTAAVLGRSGRDAVSALLHAYRAYVLANPGRYAAMPLDPLHDPALATAGGKLLAVVVSALRGFDLADSAAIHTIRMLRAVAHGFSSLEANGGFGLPQDLDATYDQIVEMVLDGLPRP
jgi:AcrR family transcriptional regulator